MKVSSGRLLTITLTLFLEAMPSTALERADGQHDIPYTCDATIAKMFVHRCRPITRDEDIVQVRCDNRNTPGLIPGLAPLVSLISGAFNPWWISWNALYDSAGLMVQIAALVVVRTTFPADMARLTVIISCGISMARSLTFFALCLHGTRLAVLYGLFFEDSGSSSTFALSRFGNAFRQLYRAYTRAYGNLPMSHLKRWTTSVPLSSEQPRQGYDIDDENDDGATNVGVPSRITRPQNNRSRRPVNSGQMSILNDQDDWNVGIEAAEDLPRQRCPCRAKNLAKNMPCTSAGTKMRDGVPVCSKHANAKNFEVYS
jgi:hypothetical protein